MEDRIADEAASARAMAIVVLRIAYLRSCWVWVINTVTFVRGGIARAPSSIFGPRPLSLMHMAMHCALRFLEQGNTKQTESYSFATLGVVEWLPSLVHAAAEYRHDRR